MKRPVHVGVERGWGGGAIRGEWVGGGGVEAGSGGALVRKVD